MRIEITGQVPAQKMKNLCYNVYMMGIYGIYRGAELLYIGQSVNMPKREKFHVWQLKRGIHPNSYLQRVHDKHGDLVFKNIENINDRDSLTSREIHHIKELQPRCNSVLPDESDNWIFSAERNLKVSRSNKGKPKTAEHRKNISLARFGKLNPMYGRPAWNKGVSRCGADNAFYGKHHTPEYKFNQSIARGIPFDMEQARSLRSEGLSYTKMAEVMGIPRKRLSKVLRLEASCI